MLLNGYGPPEDDSCRLEAGAGPKNDVNTTISCVGGRYPKRRRGSDPATPVRDSTDGAVVKKKRKIALDGAT